MNQTFPSVIKTETEVEETSWGDTEPGVTMLDGFGRCPCCGTDFSAYAGLYHCLRCSEGE